MPELDFHIEAVEVERFAVIPTMLFVLRIRADSPVENITLRCQLRIEPARRAYASGEQERLRELFGEKARWGQTLRSFLWDHITLPIPAFERESVVKLPLACSHDFNIAATKFFRGLEDGAVPLAFFFSGPVFYRDADDHLQIGQISWSKEARFALPLAIWQSLMATYYPDTTWLRVPNELFGKLARYKRENGFRDWNGTLESLIPNESEAAP